MQIRKKKKKNTKVMKLMNNAVDKQCTVNFSTRNIPVEVFLIYMPKSGIKERVTHLRELIL